MMNEDEIRGLNCDFNYHNYGVFYERIEEEANLAAGKPANGEDAAANNGGAAANEAPVSK